MIFPARAIVYKGKFRLSVHHVHAVHADFHALAQPVRGALVFERIVLFVEFVPAAFERFYAHQPFRRVFEFDEQTEIRNARNHAVEFLAHVSGKVGHFVKIVHRAFGLLRLNFLCGGLRRSLAHGIAVRLFRRGHALLQARAQDSVHHEVGITADRRGEVAVMPARKAEVPDIRGREAILKIHARDKQLAEDVDLNSIAKGTPGFTGADLENLCNEAALLAARRGSKLITMSDFSEAEIKVIAGPEKKSRVVSEHERKLTAYHEAGHAIVMHALPTHDPVHQITIVPRGGAGGMTISLPTEDRSYQSKRYMEEQIVSLLGGRVAEKLMLGDISTGASNDIQRASQIARKMVTVYGMSEKLGSISFESGHDEIFIGRSMAQAKSYSEQVAAQIDEEVKSIVDAAYERCEDILMRDRAHLIAVAEFLLAHETMSAEEFEAVFTPPNTESDKI